MEAAVAKNDFQRQELLPKLMLMYNIDSVTVQDGELLELSVTNDSYREIRVSDFCRTFSDNAFQSLEWLFEPVEVYDKNNTDGLFRIIFDDALERVDEFAMRQFRNVPAYIDLREVNRQDIVEAVYLGLTCFGVYSSGGRRYLIVDRDERFAKYDKMMMVADGCIPNDLSDEDWELIDKYIKPRVKKVFDEELRDNMMPGSGTKKLFKNYVKMARDDVKSEVFKTGDIKFDLDEMQIFCDLFGFYESTGNGVSAYMYLIRDRDKDMYKLFTNTALEVLRRIF